MAVAVVSLKIRQRWWLLSAIRALSPMVVLGLDPTPAVVWLINRGLIVAVVTEDAK